MLVTPQGNSTWDADKRLPATSRTRRREKAGPLRAELLSPPEHGAPGCYRPWPQRPGTRCVCRSQWGGCSWGAADDAGRVRKPPAVTLGAPGCLAPLACTPPLETVLGHHDSPGQIMAKGRGGKGGRWVDSRDSHSEFTMGNAPGLLPAGAWQGWVGDSRRRADKTGCSGRVQHGSCLTAADPSFLPPRERQAVHEVIRLTPTVRRL